MFCTKCGKEIPDNTKFCTYCGAPVEKTAGTQVVKREPNTSTIRKKPSGNKKQWTIAGGIVVAILLVIGIAWMVKKNSAIDLMDYVEVEFDGYDGYGTINVSYDENALDKAIEKQLGDDMPSEMEIALDGLDPYETYGYECDKTEGLSNGDTVTVTTIIKDEETVQKYGIKLKTGTKKFKVKGLEKIKTANPFEGVSLTYSGTSPELTAELTCDSSKTENDSIAELVNDANENLNDSNGYYTLDTVSDIKIGDKITATFNVGDETTFAENYGFLPSEKEKTFTCEKADKYITASSEITDDSLEKMKKQTKDVIDSYFAENKDSFEKKDLKYEGYYLLTTKSDGENSWSLSPVYNAVDVVYSTTVSDTGDGFKNKKVYLPVEYTNLIVTQDGEVNIDLDVSDIQGETSLEASSSWFNYVHGYESVDDMKNGLVISNKDDFEYEASGNLE